MLDRLQKLLTVKSIVTIILTLTFAYLAVIGEITPEQLLTVYSVVIGFYFGTQHEKKSKEDANV